MRLPFVSIPIIRDRNHELSVQRIIVDRAKARSGFKGWTKYEMADRKHIKLVANLLEYAEYSNVGKDRTAGFGVSKAWMDTTITSKVDSR